MSTYYVPCNVSPGDSISWGQLQSNREACYVRDRGGCPCSTNGYTCTQPQAIEMIDLASFGDYDNSTDIERSNHRVMREQFASELVYVYGSHGSEGLGYLGDLDDASEELRDAVAALDDYPILDESDASELAMEMESEAWGDFGCRDFARFLTDHHDGIANFHIPDGAPINVLTGNNADMEHDLTYERVLPDDSPEKATRSALGDIWFTVLADHGSGETSRIEQGGNVYFDFDDWYRTMWRARAKRAERLAELSQARAIDPNVGALLALDDHDSRAVLCDRLEELGLTEAIAHVRYYREDRLGDALAKLSQLSDQWAQPDAEVA